MALDTLRDLRRQGQRPGPPVLVVIGPVPADAQESPRLVRISEGARIADMDFRPLVGLWVAVLMTAPLYDLAMQLLDAMQDAEAKPYGFVTHDGHVTLSIANPTPEHELNLYRTWELYAK